MLIKKLSRILTAILLSTAFLSTAAGACTPPAANPAGKYYVATNGNDDNPGTLQQPFASIAKAQEAASPGDTVYIRGGTYQNFTIANTDSNYHYVNEITKSNITYEAYPNEKPVFDFSGIPTDKRVAAFHIVKGVQNVRFISIKVTGVPVGNQKQSECFRIEGNAVFDQVTCYNNQANGFYFTNHGSGECYRCDSYNNIGIGPSIGNTDGFGAHADGVTFIECRAWNDSDDGFDCISSKGANTFISCWAFDMKAGGDSNGFKIGGFGKKAITFEPPVHTVANCIAADNAEHGFYANHQPGQAAVWAHNSAYNNGLGNFNMLECATISDPTDIPGTREELHDNLAYSPSTLDQANLPQVNNTDNSWNISGLNLTADDFQSLNVRQLSGARGPHGELPHITFMQLNNRDKIKGLGYLEDGKSNRILQLFGVHVRLGDAQ